MAAIDPDEAPEYEDGFDSNKRPRATLKLVRAPPGLDLEGEDDDDEDWEDDEDEDSEDDEEVNGGPSDKEKARKLKLAAARKELEDAMDEDDDEDEDDEEGEFDLKAAISKLIKGKAPANDDEESDAESDEGLELDETVICTLDPEKVCETSESSNASMRANPPCRTASSLSTSLSTRRSPSSSRLPVPTPST